MSLNVDQALKKSRSFNCLECGKCTAVCPVSEFKEDFSPRRTISQMLSGLASEEMEDRVWDCLTCGYCSVICPMTVDYTDLMKEVRKDLIGPEIEPKCSHGGALQSIMRLMMNKDLKQKRLDWITDDLKVSREKGDVVYFTGCLPYYDSYFSYLNLEVANIGRQTVRLLNAIGVNPVIMKDERCCGHDLLWSGDEIGFTKLNEMNLEAIRETGASMVVTSCAECYRSLKFDVPEIMGKLDVEVLHTTQLLYRHIDTIAGKTRSKVEGTVTYHDPCRLGRLGGIYEEPRALLSKTGPVEFTEMLNNREHALCCGTSSWMNCNSGSKQIQLKRLREAEQVGAKTMATACPKCLIHFTCAMEENGQPQSTNVTVRDITDVLASSL